MWVVDTRILTSRARSIRPSRSVPTRSLRSLTWPFRRGGKVLREVRASGFVLVPLSCTCYTKQRSTRAPPWVRPGHRRVSPRHTSQLRQAGMRTQGVATGQQMQIEMTMHDSGSIRPSVSVAVAYRSPRSSRQAASGAAPQLQYRATPDGPRYRAHRRWRPGTPVYHHQPRLLDRPCSFACFCCCRRDEDDQIRSRLQGRNGSFWHAPAGCSWQRRASSGCPLPLVLHVRPHRRHRPDFVAARAWHGYSVLGLSGRWHA